MTTVPGVRVGVYEVLEFAGQGGMGAVYRARDTALRRLVALKVSPADLADVKNPVAQKHLRAMAPGERVFFYHTGDEKAIVGTARVAAAPYLDPGSTDLSLYAVELTCGAALAAPVTLKAVKADPRFADFALTRLPRLSVMPVTDAQWAMLTAMAQA